MNTNQSSLTRPRNFFYIRQLVPLLLIRPGPSMVWASTSFLSRADQVSFSLVNAARSSSDDVTSRNWLINGVSVYRHWRHTLSLQAVALQSNTYKDTFQMYLLSFMVIAGKWHQSKGRRNSLSPPIAVKAPQERLNLKIFRKQPESKPAPRETKAQEQSPDHPVTITACYASGLQWLQVLLI